MLPVMRYRSTGAYATATGTGAWAASHAPSCSQSRKLAPRCELRVTLVHAPDTTSLWLLRELIF